MPKFGLISKLKISWYNDTLCAYIVNQDKFHDNQTNPIIIFDMEDIELLMDQAECSLENAIEALISNDLDL